MNLLDDYTLRETRRLEHTSLFQNYDRSVKIMHLLLITDESGSYFLFPLHLKVTSTIVLDTLDEPGELVILAKKWDIRACVLIRTYFHS
jgi:hypothetical protein